MHYLLSGVATLIIAVSGIFIKISMDSPKCSSTTFRLDGIINDKVAANFEKSIRDSKDDVITIYIDSHGGNVEAALNIMNTMRDSKKTYICIANKAYSAAFMIYTECQERYIEPTGSVLLHGVRLIIGNEEIGIVLRQQELEAMARNVELINQIICSRIAKNLGWEYIRCRYIAQFEYITTAEEVVDAGVATIIKNSQCNIQK